MPGEPDERWKGQFARKPCSHDPDTLHQKPKDLPTPQVPIVIFYYFISGTYTKKTLIEPFYSRTLHQTESQL